jgi:hypothetical protein
VNISFAAFSSSAALSALILARTMRTLICESPS